MENRVDSSWLDVRQCWNESRYFQRESLFPFNLRCTKYLWIYFMCDLKLLGKNGKQMYSCTIQSVHLLRSDIRMELEFRPLNKCKVLTFPWAETIELRFKTKTSIKYFAGRVIHGAFSVLLERWSRKLCKIDTKFFKMQLISILAIRYNRGQLIVSEQLFSLQ